MEKSGSAWAVYFYADKPPKLGVVQPSWCVQGDGPDTPTVGSNCMVKWQGRGKPFPAIFLDQEIGKTVKEAYKSLEDMTAMFCDGKKLTQPKTAEINKRISTHCSGLRKKNKKIAPLPSV
ncbi:hypothetical protein RvY_19307-2 [Ramazzottius varieornatus]|uniref:Uncharacterized protein n=1 Tax=Ramazzottius varieornatus TaxID=947166 RepID=A0A1D1W8Y8_RAMVA|nr:hypothetical protein RvY_19307-2 [Ramazzottius varieornatus]